LLDTKPKLSFYNQLSKPSRQASTKKNSNKPAHYRCYFSWPNH